MKLSRRPFLVLGSLGALVLASTCHAGANDSSPEGRFEKIERFDFDRLPLGDAIKIVHGSGKRRLAVFSDPNCGHCKRVDKDLKAIGDVTVYVFLYPVLGADSQGKSRGIWCSKEKQKAWIEWVEAGTAPANAPDSCDTGGLQRGMELGRRYKAEGTPMLIFNDGTRVPGAIPAQWIARLLAASAK